MASDRLIQKARKLARLEPSAENWVRVATFLDAATGRDREAEAVDLMSPALKRWPNNFRNAPKNWIRHFADTGSTFPRWGLVRRVELSATDEIVSEDMLRGIEILYAGPHRTIHELSLIAQAKSLKQLSCTSSLHLTTSDTFRSLSELEWLDISHSPNLDEIDGLSHLSKLKTLRMKNLGQVESLDAISGLPLRYLHVSGLPSLNFVANSLDLDELSVLEFDAAPLGDVNFVANLPKLTSLDLVLPNGTYERSPLKSLPLLETLRLENADLSGGVLQGQTELRKLALVNCRAPMQSNFPPSLDRLEWLEIAICPQLSSLNALPPLPKLQDLYLRSNDNLSDIDAITVFPSLKRVFITDCPNIENVEMLRISGGLEELTFG